MSTEGPPFLTFVSLLPPGDLHLYLLHVLWDCRVQEARPGITQPSHCRLEHEWQSMGAEGQAGPVTCIQVLGSAVCNTHSHSLPRFLQLRSGDMSHSSHLTELAVGTCWPLSRSCLSRCKNTLCSRNLSPSLFLYFTQRWKWRLRAQGQHQTPRDLPSTGSAPRSLRQTEVLREYPEGQPVGQSVHGRETFLGLPARHCSIPLLT